MTTLNQARTAVYQAFIEAWPIGALDDISLWTLIYTDVFGPGTFVAFVSGEDRCPYCFDNEAFTPPLSSDGRGLPWARLSVRGLSSGQETIGQVGNRKFTRSAIVRLEIYTPPATGLKAADLLIEAGMRTFEGKSLLGTTLKTYDARTQEVGLVDEGRWFLSTVQVSFDYEEIK